MNEWLQQLFNPMVVIFTVANLAAMGLELNLRDALTTPAERQGHRADPASGAGWSDRRWPGSLPGSFR